MIEDDEDRAPPLRNSAPPPAAVAPSGGVAPGATAAGDVLVWGVCAVYNQRAELAEFPGERGVCRFVTSGVRFVQPPGLREWRRSVTVPDRFEMKWGGDPAAARTLAALRADLERAARSGELDAPGAPLLKELDRVVIELVELAGRLHRAGWSVGLLRPDNVFLADRELVLVDLGFAWQGMFGPPPWDDSPGRPAWVEASAGYAWLYDQPPVRQQLADPGNGVYPPASPTDDVRTLGRLIAWVLSGHEHRDLPPVRVAAPVWAVLEAAVAGKVSTAQDLANRLRSAPPSTYFQRPEPPALPSAQKGSGKRWLAPAVVLVALAAGGAAAAWYFTRPAEQPAPVGRPVVQGPPAEPTPQPGVTKPPLADLLKEMERTRDRGALFALLRKAYDKTFDPAPPGLKAARDVERGRALDLWVAAYQEADALAAQPDQRLSAADRFAALKVDLESLQQAGPPADPTLTAKEQQCLEFVSARVRELLGSRP